MKIVSALAFVLMLMLDFVSTAQTPELKLRSGNYRITELSLLTWSDNAVFQDQFTRIIVFQTIPTSEEKSNLASAGIQLLDYLPSNAFYASISTDVDWSQLSNATVLEIKPEYKKSELLRDENYPHWTLFGTNQIELIGFYFDPYTREDAQKQLISLGGTVVSQDSYQHIMNIRIPLDQLELLYKLPGFYYFETLSDTPQPENFSGRTNHRSNMLATSYNGGITYTGEGVKVMMQDDGFIGPHIDYTGRIDQSDCNSCSTSSSDTHGDHVSGTIMGAGNLDPENRGMAHGVDLKVYNSSDANYSLFPGLFDNEDVVITSKSYSNGCNAGYTSLPRLLDQQVHDRPQLMHVFSAGNSGADNCNYGAGAGWGNITGGHKVGKNVIAVGNLSSTDVLAGSSSRGPAEDGRIKPDICAVGSSVTSTGPENIYFTISGTSMACPGVSGTIAQLYDAYRDMNGGANPDAALIKSAVLNTAEDLGNYGPDFKFGWGRINARQSYELLSNNQYINSSISQGATNTHTISVPAGVSELRIMTYWTDYEGSTSAALALVNDLNMVVTDPNLIDYNPWVLDPTPNATSLNAPAVRGIDALNNMEQVTVLDPVSGTYEVNVNGFAVPQGPQDYYVVYYFVMEDVTVTYPIGGEGVTPGSTLIRWDASEGTTDFTLEYTTDNGTNWTSIGTAPADRRYANWNVPNLISGLAKVRVTRNGSSDESDAVFSIISTPTNIQFDWVCPDSTKLSWNPVSGATSYEVSQLGAKYMDSIGTTTATNFVVPIASNVDTWFSVRALGPDNARGERAIAVQKPTTEFGCLWSAPIAGFDVDCDGAGTGHCFDLIDGSVNTSGGSSYTWYFPGGTPATSSSASPTVCYSAAGNYDVAMVVANGFGTDSIYITNAITVLDTRTLPYVEGFENYTTFLATDAWETSSPGNATPFLVTGQAALTGSKSAMLLNYNQPANAEDELISGPIDLSTLNTNDTMTLSFRYAFRKKQSVNNDFLRVSVREGCEANWVVRKTLFGDLLSPLTSSTSWYPAGPEDWTTVHMTNITSNYFTGDFQFKFTFENDGGNNLFIDDINIYQGAPSDEIIGLSELTALQNVSVYPVPTNGELSVTFELNSAEKTRIDVTDITGKTVQTVHLNGAVGNNITVMDVANLSSGVYFLTVISGGNTAQKRFIVE